MNEIAHYLPHVNALLNLLATLLLAAGYVFIKQKREAAHKRAMFAAFGVSAAFLASYLVYHYAIGGSKKFPSYPPAAVRYLYYGILIPHIILAVFVPFLAGWTIRLGLLDKRAAHRKWAKITFPIWMFVSVTGVLVYVMLYLLYPPQ